MIDSSAPVYCANHPGVETSLRCNNCGKPICARCAIHTPTGYRCAECVRGQQKIFNTARWVDYLLGFITGILFLVLAPYNQNKTIRFHAFQSIFMHVAFIIFWIVVGMIMPLSVSLILSPIIGLGGLVLWLFMMWKAYQNQKVKLPLIGDLAEKQA